MKVKARQDHSIDRIGPRGFCAGASQIFSGLLLSVTALAAPTLAQSGASVPVLETIVARMAQARAENISHFRPYTITRGYTLFGREREKSQSEVTADVTFAPPDLKQYAIGQSQGSGLGEILVRRMLAGEAEITKNSVSTDFSRQNYDFRFIRQEDFKGQHCYVLELLPKRQNKNLVRGSIWVDANTYLIRRTEGEPAKSPSWWLHDIRLSFLYGEVGGMWLQTSSEATATVRLFGQHTMVTRDISYRLSEAVATEPKAALRALIPEVVPAALVNPGSSK